MSAPSPLRWALDTLAAVLDPASSDPDILSLRPWAAPLGDNAAGTAVSMGLLSLAWERGLPVRGWHTSLEGVPTGEEQAHRLWVEAEGTLVWANPIAQPQPTLDTFSTPDAAIAAFRKTLGDAAPSSVRARCTIVNTAEALYISSVVRPALAAASREPWAAYQAACRRMALDARLNAAPPSARGQPRL